MVREVALSYFHKAMPIKREPSFGCRNTLFYLRVLSRIWRLHQIRKPVVEESWCILKDSH